MIFEVIDDPLLAISLFDSAWVAEQGRWTRRFAIWRSETPAARAWFVPDADATEALLLDDWSGDPRHILNVLRDARPLSAESRTPEECTIRIEATESGWVIVSQLADPQWQARWINLEHPRMTQPDIRPAFRKAGENSGWQCIRIPGAGRWTLGLQYEANDVAIGFLISFIAWAGWLLVLLRTGARTWRATAAPARTTTEV